MFFLTIPVTTVNIELIKSELRISCPHVKSSHRCEGVARGLGYRTYAALLADAKSIHPNAAIVNEGQFVAYLGEQGFGVEALSLYRAVGLAAFRAALEMEPILTQNGMGIPQGLRDINGVKETISDRRAVFEKDRAEFQKSKSLDPFLLSLSLVQRIEKTRTMRNLSSYGLKHLAENSHFLTPEGIHVPATYVSNGTFIAAAIYAGFSYKPPISGYIQSSLNLYFNMSKKSIILLENEFRPRGASAQYRQRKRDRG